jgi:guanylate kinase
MTKIIGLLGPSASGKTAIAEELLRDISFQKPKTATTRAIREGESENAYFFFTQKEFLEKMSESFFLETSVYAGKYYGTPLSAITDILDSEHIAVVPIDINGIKAYKERFGDNFLAIFIYRNREEIINAILERTISEEEKKRRIASLDDEYQNIKYCDYAVVNNGTINDAVEKIKKLI